MAKVNSGRPIPKGVRLRWASLKEATSVRLSPDAIHGTRSSSNGNFATRAARSGKSVEKTTVKNQNISSNDNFIIP